MLKVGDTAPDFEVKAHTGQLIKLSALRGKKVVLWFYPEADTPGCTKEGCGFRDRMQEYEIMNVRILGVSFNSVESNRAFAEKFKFTYPLLCDTERTIGIAYGACKRADDRSAKRISYVIDENGKVMKAYAEVSAANHPGQVLQDLLG